MYNLDFLWRPTGIKKCSFRLYLPGGDTFASQVLQIFFTRTDHVPNWSYVSPWVLMMFLTGTICPTSTVDMLQGY